MSSIWRKLFSKQYEFENKGYCPICKREVMFYAIGSWFRDQYFCPNCHSIPRERALMYILDTEYPNWRELVIHESSPGNRGVSVILANECKNYIPSQYFPNEKLGELFNGVRCENLEKLTFLDESIDLHISQDVFEHIFLPDLAFKEIYRTLRPGGAHIFTVPLVNKTKPSKFRAKIEETGQTLYLEQAIFHGNPIDAKGSLVTIDWGFDICNFIYNSSGLFTRIIQIDDISKGIRAEYIEVLVTYKPYTESELFKSLSM